MQDIFDELDKLIDSIADSCPKEARKLGKLKKAAEKCSCAADTSKKQDIFDDFQKAIDEGKINCPDKTAEYDAIQDLLDRAQTVRCGGG